MNLKSLFGSSNDRYIKKLRKIVSKINALEPDFEKLSDEELRAKTTEFKNRLLNGETVDDLLVEAFATVREGAKRALGLRPFDVQLIGGMVLNNHQIAEMKTGEGKTLVATLPVYLNALTGKGVHVVTVNDYLAKRDSDWMGKLYTFLGLSVGCIIHGLNTEERRAAYNCDITYGTNNEFGFDYLRDNMCFSLGEMVQRPFNYAIVDEVDSILIDEARTPLIISGRAEDSSERYMIVDKIMKNVRPEHYDKDEKHRNVMFTENGAEWIENELKSAGLIQGALYDVDNISYVHHVEQALRAHTVFTRDVDYIVKDDKIVIIDEFTGRQMEGRRYSDGLHQAIEAKEHVSIQAENQTLASITFQNYFRMYPKLAGMTGTAMTEAGEFDDIYHLEVVEIPTNRSLARIDEQDIIYRTAAEKYDAIIAEIQSAYDRKQPVLVGTTSIEKSEILAELLRAKTNIPFNVLNARHHEKEAYIVAQAGRPGAVTIATNMAGRGTDIQLGGNFEMRLMEEKEKNPDMDEAVLAEQIRKEIAVDKEIALSAGGLFVLGCERHESRRIDNQLRGRSGRQGDPGLSKFYVSLEDDLMRIFGSERIGNILRTLGLKQGQSIVHPWISGAIAKAQQKVEAYHFDVRKNLLKYDDVMNDQRKVIYEQRKELMEAKNVWDVITDMRDDCIENMVYAAAPSRTVPEDWDIDGLSFQASKILAMDVPFKSWAAEPGMTPETMIERLKHLSAEALKQKMSIFPPELQIDIEKSVLIQSIDQNWKEHLQGLDFMRISIGLRAYGQRNPLNEYKRESFFMFDNMLARVREHVTTRLSHAPFQQIQQPQGQTQEQHPSADHIEEDIQQQESKPIISDKTPRNALCPCGSGKKYKHCCGKI